MANFLPSSQGASGHRVRVRHIFVFPMVKMLFEHMGSVLVAVPRLALVTRVTEEVTHLAWLSLFNRRSRTRTPCAGKSDIVRTR